MYPQLNFYFIDITDHIHAYKIYKRKVNLNFLCFTFQINYQTDSRKENAGRES